MAYVAVPDKAPDDVFTETMWDQSIKANFEATFVHIAAAAGDMAYATAANTVAVLTKGTTDDMLVAGAAAPEWQTTPCCHMQADNNQAIGAAGWTTVTYVDADSTIVDAGSMHTADSTRITIPVGCGGFYTYGCCAKFDASGDNTNNWKFGVRVILGGVNVIAAHTQAYEYLLDGEDVSLSLSSGRFFTAETWIEFQVYTTVAINILNEGLFSPVFWASWQRRT